MHNVMILGAGRMGTLTAYQLAATGDYQILLIDIAKPEAQLAQVLDQQTNIQFETTDVTDNAALLDKISANTISSIISCLPFYCNRAIIELAAKQDLNYFDLTEDTESSELVWQLAKDKTSAFVPQCGIAPGFINIIANHLIEQFKTVDDVKLCVGALPLQTSNPLQYALTWSTDEIGRAHV